MVSIGKSITDGALWSEVYDDAHVKLGEVGVYLLAVDQTIIY
jgi:hypothetical protein